MAPRIAMVAIGLEAVYHGTIAADDQDRIGVVAAGRGPVMAVPSLRDGVKSGARGADPVAARPEDRIDVRESFPAIAATVTICGAASNAGKTWLCESVLRGLASEGRRTCALKVTRTHLGDCPRGITTCGTCDSVKGVFE